MSTITTVSPPSTFVLEAHAAVDAAVMLHRIAVTLPTDSKIRRRMLEDSEGYVLGAALRGVQSPIAGALLAELDTDDQMTDEQLPVAA